MKLSELFTTKAKGTPQSETTPATASNAALDLDALDDCVGGRAETDGVGCYVHFTQPSAH